MNAVQPETEKVWCSLSDAYLLLVYIIAHPSINQVQSYFKPLNDSLNINYRKVYLVKFTFFKAFSDGSAYLSNIYTAVHLHSIWNNSAVLSPMSSLMGRGGRWTILILLFLKCMDNYVKKITISKQSRLFSSQIILFYSFLVVRCFHIETYWKPIYMFL